MGSFEVLSPCVLWLVISRAPHKNNTINHKRIPIFFFRAEMALLSWHAFSFLSHVFVLCSIHKYPTIINTSLCFAKIFFKKGNYCGIISPPFILWFVDMHQLTNYLIWLLAKYQTDSIWFAPKNIIFYSILVFRCLHEVWLLTPRCKSIIWFSVWWYIYIVSDIIFT